MRLGEPTSDPSATAGATDLFVADSTHLGRRVALSDRDRPRSTTITDLPGLVRIFRHLRGRRLVGVVDCFDGIELVFEPGEVAEGNLVTIFTEGRFGGQVAFGFVCREWIDEGYGR